MASTTTHLLRLLTVALLLAAPSASAFPYKLSYAGRLIEPKGKPVDGPVDLEVSFFDASTGGSPIGPGALPFPGTKLIDGVFQITIEMSPADFDDVFALASTSVY